MLEGVANVDGNLDRGGEGEGEREGVGVLGSVLRSARGVGGGCVEGGLRGCVERMY